MVRNSLCIESFFRVPHVTPSPPNMCFLCEIINEEIVQEDHRILEISFESRTLVAMLFAQITLGLKHLFTSYCH